MIETLQLEEQAVATHDAPRLLVAWTPRWQNFVGSIRPAFARSEARLAGEAPFGLIPLRIMVPSYFLEAFMIFAAIAIPIKINQLRPYAAPRISAHEVIYYSGDELPRTEDLGGSESGRTGRAGGAEAHHRTQTIKIARGSMLTPRVVDAPNLKIPASRDAVANLLAIKPNAGPPPSEGLRSTRSVPNLSASVVAPAPNAIRDYTRNGIQLDQVIAPVQNVSRDVTTAPVLSAKVVPPAPSISSDHPLYAPVLAPEVIPPAPRNVSRDRASNAPPLTASVVAPAPALNDHQSRSAPSLASNVIPPAPGAVSREVSSSPVQMANIAVVPPPVSAPERASTRDPKLTLPAPSVIAPPPSSDISQDMRRLASGSAPDPAKTVVPPPPTQSGSGSFLGNLVGKLFGASDVVPPPPTVNTNGSSSNSGRSLAPNVVPPPPNVNASGQNSKPQLAANVVPPPATLSGTSATDSRGRGNGAGPSLNANVVAPPPSVGVAGGSGNRSMYSSTAPTLGAPKVVPPPPSLSSIGGGTGKTAGGAGSPGGTLTAANVVPPPPAIGGGSASTGSGTGRKGPGFAGSLDVGAPPAPVTNGGSGSSAGAVISSQPGSKVGLPAPSTGSLALSPAGNDKPGLGGAGAGTGIGRGTGPGSGISGEASGAGKTGTSRGSETSARGGISPTTGPGGAGNSNSGNPPVPGVSINGGSSEITLPSFGDDPAADPSSPNRTATRKHGDRLDVTVVASASAGGAFEAYKNLLHGETYTTYFDTSAGPLSMEFADEAAGSHAFGGSLTAPSPIRIDLPEGLPRARLALKCTLDASGNVKNIHVLDAGPAEMTAKVVAALRSWKFQPAMRGAQPVEVTAILGFNIDTNDRF